MQHRKEWMTFEEARAYVHTLGLKNLREWKNYYLSGKKPKDVPSAPHIVYKDNWAGYGDWLGTNNKLYNRGEWLLFEEARAYIHSLNLKNFKEWEKYHLSGEKPKNIPSAPHIVYKDKWTDWADWLDAKNKRYNRKEWMPFEEARSYAHSLKLKNLREWKKYSTSGQKPNNIPSDPYKTYKNEWKGYGDWLGTGKIASCKITFLPFEEARAYVHSLKLKGCVEWKKYYTSEKKPSNIPTDPKRVYKDKWINWNDWLGTNNKQYNKGEWIAFEEARSYVRSLELKNTPEWEEYKKSEQRPSNIPSHPHIVYKDKWEGWADWLGTNNKQYHRGEWVPFEEARTHAQSLRLKNTKEWEKYCLSGQKPNNVPSHPHTVYKNEWQGMNDWLGTNWLSFEDARTHVHSLNLKNAKEWWSYCTSGDKPKNIPTRPHKVYKTEWVNWTDWLGTSNNKQYN